MKLRIETYLQSFIVDCEKFKIDIFTEQGCGARLMVHVIDKNLHRNYYVCSSVELL